MFSAHVFPSNRVSRLTSDQQLVAAEQRRRVSDSVMSALRWVGFISAQGETSCLTSCQRLLHFNILNFSTLHQFHHKLTEFFSKNDEINQMRTLI